MPGRLQNKVALITGAGGGIGRASAHAFAVRVHGWSSSMPSNGPAASPWMRSTRVVVPPRSSVRT